MLQKHYCPRFPIVETSVWDGMGWDGMGWDDGKGMSWDGMGWKAQGLQGHHFSLEPKLSNN